MQIQTIQTRINWYRICSQICLIQTIMTRLYWHRLPLPYHAVMIWQCWYCLSWLILSDPDWYRLSMTTRTKLCCYRLPLTDYENTYYPERVCWYIYFWTEYTDTEYPGHIMLMGSILLKTMLIQIILTRL